MLRRVEGADVVGEAADGFAVIRLARELKPDLVILDVRMPRMNGLHAAKRLRQDHSKVKILALSAHDEASMVRMLLHCGVSGYILKTDLVPELVKAVETVVRGEIYLSNKLSHVSTGEFSPTSKLGNEAILSDIQREILRLKRSGASIEKIAGQTLLSVRTVQRHLRRIDALTGSQGSERDVAAAQD